MNIEIQKEDIYRIGHTWFPDKEGNLCIIANVEMANFEYILLRNILSCFGNYSIIGEDDFFWENGKVNIKFKTDMPYSLLP